MVRLTLARETLALPLPVYPMKDFEYTVRVPRCSRALT